MNNLTLRCKSLFLRLSSFFFAYFPETYIFTKPILENMTYRERFQILRQKTTESYNYWLLAQNELASAENGFTNQNLWDNLDIAASNLQKAQNEFNKLCSIIQKDRISQDDIFSEQQACA